MTDQPFQDPYRSTGSGGSHPAPRTDGTGASAGKSSPANPYERPSTSAASDNPYERGGAVPPTGPAASSEEPSGAEPHGSVGSADREWRPAGGGAQPEPAPYTDPAWSRPAGHADPLDPYAAPGSAGTSAPGPMPGGQDAGQPYAGQGAFGGGPGYGTGEGGYHASGASYQTGPAGQGHPPYGPSTGSELPGPAPAGVRGVHTGPLTGQPLSASDSRLWAVLAQLSAVAGYLVGFGVLGWLGPLIIYLVFKDRDRFVRYNAAECLNAAIATVIADVALSIVLTLFTMITFGLGVITFVLLFVPTILHFVFAIIGAVKANGGQWWNYPINLRLVS